MSTEIHEMIRAQLEATRQAQVWRLSKIERDLRQADGPLPADVEDRAQELENDEVLQGLDESGRWEVAQIDAALARLDDGHYGICVDCEAPIAPRRLRALPSATRCIRCAERAEAS